MSEWPKIEPVSKLEFNHSVNLTKIGDFQPTINYRASFEAANDKMYVGTKYNDQGVSVWLTWSEALELKKWIDRELFKRKLPID